LIQMYWVKFVDFRSSGRWSSFGLARMLRKTLSEIERTGAEVACFSDKALTCKLCAWPLKEGRNVRWKGILTDKE
jgi:hypothetical protein